MNFDQLVTHIKSQGCRIRLWRNKEYVYNTAGIFYITEHGPLINLAMKGDTIKKNTTTLLHEYGHFLQWKDGFLPHIDEVCNTDELYWEWLDAKRELTTLEWQIARNTMLWIEWDAEMRGHAQAIALDICDFDSDYYIRGAMGYIMSIKWSWDNRLIWKKSIQSHHISKTKIYTTNELFAPLMQTEKVLTKHIKR